DTSGRSRTSTQKYNLAYTNSTCHTVSEEVRAKLLNKSQPYEVGETLVCRSWFKVQKQVFNVNYEYEITAVEGDMITLSNSTSLPVSLIKKTSCITTAGPATPSRAAP
ncbi:MAG: hypothetical protein ACKPKO_63665, partial [Candidatus Fonsibacter sp.]